MVNIHFRRMEATSPTAEIKANQSSSKSFFENFNLEKTLNATIGNVMHINTIAIRLIWPLLDSVGTAAQSCILIALASANPLTIATALDSVSSLNKSVALHAS
jgi:hypothetical protein